MREKAEILFDAVTNIREELVEEAQDYVFRRRAPWRRYMPLAACLALAVCLGWFGLLFSGGMGGSSDMSANSAPPAASMDAAPQEPVPGGSSMGGGEETSGCPLPAPVQRTFTARVVEIGEGTLLTRPLPGGDLPAGADRAEVSLEGLEELPDLQAGDKVEISFTGELEEAYPLRVTGVTEIRLAG